MPSSAETQETPPPAAGASTEVVPKARRRFFTAAEKLRIVEAADGLGQGEIGALLRREGLYSSLLTDWRRLRAAGQLSGEPVRRRGPQPDPQAAELKRQQLEIARLQRQLARAEAIIEAQKKSPSCWVPSRRPSRTSSREGPGGTLAQITGVTAACAALDVPRSTLYRQRRPAPPPATRPTPPPAQQRALSAAGQATMRDTLNSPAYADCALREVYATVLEQGTYLCSVATMYRVLRANGEVRERRDQLRHPAYAAPELLATAPNQVWTWHITRLLGPHKWTYFYLYFVLDLFSRKVVCWLRAKRRRWPKNWWPRPARAKASPATN